jgi:hypothetical protein
MFGKQSAVMWMLAAIVASVIAPTSAGAAPRGTPAQQAAPAAAHQLGTIKAIHGSTITLTTDAGENIDVQVADTTRIVSVEPGSKDLKNAVVLSLKDLQAGDRILARGQASADQKSLAAVGIIAMKHTDLEAKKQHERDDWQKRGIGGLVSGVDPAAGTVTVGVGVAAAKTNVTVHISKATVVRRYVSDSVKFDDAKPSTLDQIKPGDQIRARGTRSADGSEFTAEEIVAGSFQNIDGPITAIDPAANTVSVMDAITKHPIVVKISAESQVRKLPPEMAQRIAMRLTASAGGDAAAPSAGAATPGASAPSKNAPPAASASSPSGGSAAPGAGRAGAGNSAGPGGRTPDFQQFLARLPASSIADLQKGDVVMVVATQGATPGDATAISLIGGVELLLTASPRGAREMLSPWSLGGGGGDAGADATP